MANTPSLVIHRYMVFAGSPTHAHSRLAAGGWHQFITSTDDVDEARQVGVRLIAAPSQLLWYHVVDRDHGTIIAEGRASACLYCTRTGRLRDCHACAKLLAITGGEHA